MGVALILIIGLLIGGGAAGAIFALGSRTKGSGDSLAQLETELAKRRELVQRASELYDSMIEVSLLRERAAEYRAAQDSLKAERGRITITQAELETVETRLRELEEIERELEASGLETKEELNILQKKQKELAARNEALREQIRTSTEQWQQLMAEAEISAQVQEQVEVAKTELIKTEEKITNLLIQIEAGNDQYFHLKRRYDALDIEYAQLYEKFSEAEAMVGSRSKGEE